MSTEVPISSASAASWPVGLVSAETAVGPRRSAGARRAAAEQSAGRRPTPPSLALENFRAGAAFVAPEGNRSPAYLTLKRAADLAGAILLLSLLAPIMLLTLLVLIVTTKGNPFFVQERVGYLGRRFPMIKFRTMRLDADKMRRLVRNEHASGPVFKNRCDPRITRVGRILRRTSIDETPQLINVLLGHMSLVGPRPPVPREVLQYQPWQRRRLAVMPGLTCLWQISGRSEIGFEDWVRMDLWYVKRQGLGTDLKLLLKTPWSVLSCRGAY